MGAWMTHALYVKENEKEDGSWLGEEYEQKAYFMGVEAGRMEVYGDLLEKVLKPDTMNKLMNVIYKEFEELQKEIENERS